MTKDHKFKSESEIILSQAYNIAKEELSFTRFKSQIILMMKNNFCYYVTINYDKSASVCIDLSHVVAKKTKNKNKNVTQLSACETN